MSPIRKHKKSAARGFTLVEMAIVLGVASVIFGGLWVAATNVSRNNQQARVLQQVLTIAQNVRDFYGASQGVWYANGTDITNAVNLYHLVPMEMRSNKTSDNSLVFHGLGTTANGSLHLWAVASPTGSAGQMLSVMTLRIQLLGLTETDCTNLLMRMPVLSPEIGIVRLGTATGATTVDVSNIANPGTVTLPLTFNQAQSWCTRTDRTNEVDIDFKVRN